MCTQAGWTVERLLDSLDLDAKVRLLTGASFWTTHADETIGLRAMVFSDGPAGVRGPRWDERDPAVNLPSPTALAATWDDRLVTRLGALLAAEARRKQVDVLLAPTVNLHRSPLGGRHFECLSEDPLLSGRIGAAYVHGVQAHGVAATAKHYVANDSETARFTVDVRVDERTLRELYLAPFEQLVTEGGAWLVMAAYNSVNGATMTENPLLATPLKTAWGFDGVVVSDWYATRSTEAAARAGLDLVMPGPEGPWGPALAAAVREGRVAEAAVDGKVRRLLRLAARVGALEGAQPAAPPVRQPGPDETAALLREASAAAMVLVRNHSEVLPLEATSLRRVAVLGPNAAEARTQGGGSATVFPPYVVSPLEGLRAALGDGIEVTTAVGAHLQDGLAPVAEALVTCPRCGNPGFAVRYLDRSGNLLRAEHRSIGRLAWLGDRLIQGATVQVAARFRANTTGDWRIGLAGVGAFSLTLDGELVLDEVVRPATGTFADSFLFPPQRAVTRTLAEGDELEVVLVHQFPAAAAIDMTTLTFGAEAPRQADDVELARAVELAKEADVAVVVVGTTDRVETEGLDRTSLALPGRQDDLVRAIAVANPRTVVVVNSGGPVAMPWRQEVPAVLLSWFPGQEFGHALADVLFGTIEPGGRLPTTWAARLQDAPVRSTRPVNGALDYAEGLHIGYRAWQRAGVTPAYPFGHGLGYTTWTYESIEAPSRIAAGDELTARIRLRNTGRRTGKQVVQVYLSRPASSIDRPALWLAGYEVVRAGAGQRVTAQVRVAPRAFQHWSVADHEWRIESGPFRLTAGPSVADQPLGCDVEATEEPSSQLERT